MLREQIDQRWTQTYTIVDRSGSDLGAAMQLEIDLPGDEGIEREICYEGTVEELDDAGQHEEDEKRIDNFELLGCCVDVRIV